MPAKRFQGLDAVRELVARRGRRAVRLQQRRACGRAADLCDGTISSILWAGSKGPMSPNTKGIYTASGQAAGGGEIPPPRRPFRIWWDIATPAERWSAVFVIFSITVLIGILVGIAWYQHEQITRFRRRGELGAGGEKRAPKISFVSPIELDASGRLHFDELEDAAAEPSPLEPPTDITSVTPAAILQTAIWLRRAERAAAEQEWAGALTAYEEASKIFPESVRIREQLGLCQLRERDYAGAAATFGWLAERRPNAAGIWNNLGVAEAGRDRYEEAQAAFERALAVDSTHRFAARNLAVLAYRRGEMARAVEALSTVLQRDPDDFEAALMCSVALLRTGRHAEAVARLEDLASRSPSAPVWFYLAEARARLGQNGTALQALDRAVAMVDARTAIAWLNRPEMDRLRGDPEFQKRWSKIASDTP
ncbi:MAG: tetratricopeptide repeat protein [Kiritimatiellae bacterium]|nr:tetratricopeptide repeat protein [Kiritimatiellia bacterium]